MAVSPPDPDSLLALNFDCLAHIATFLTSHELTFVLPFVCRALNSVANDPVVWARIPVYVGSTRELLHIARKHPSIRCIVPLPFMQLVHPETYAEMAKLCPELCEWEEITPHYGIRLRAATFTFDFDLPEDCFSSLRSLKLEYPESGDDVERVVESCVNLRSLSCCGFIAAYPNGLPELRKLTTTGDSITHESWRAFAQSHPHLHTLELLDVKSLPGAAFEPGLPALVDFTYSVGNDSGSLGYGILASSPLLSNLSWNPPADAAFFTALSNCKALSVLIISRWIDTVPAAVLERFANSANLRCLVVPARSPAKGAMLDACGPQLGFVDEWMITDAFLRRLSGKLRYVSTLSLGDTEVSVESCQTLGNEIATLREVTIWCGEGMTVAHCDALAPALSRIRTLALYNASAIVSPLLEAAANSHTLLRLYLRGGDVGSCSDFFKFFLDAWNGPPLDTLDFGNVDADCVQLLFGAAVAGKLSAYTASVRARMIGLSRGEYEDLRGVIDKLLEALSPYTTSAGCDA